MARRLWQIPQRPHGLRESQQEKSALLPARPRQARLFEVGMAAAMTRGSPVATRPPHLPAWRITMSKRQLSLNAFILPTGHHIAAWRRPDVPAHSNHDFQEYVRVARAAEAAAFDAVFVSDSVAAASGNGGSSLEDLALTARGTRLEPFTLLSALAAVTDRIGLIGTASTTYNEPYNLARRFASLDWISGGRAGWNLVTSSAPAEALNFNQNELPAHAERYQRAEEFLDVVQGLWDSWEDDAFIRDKASGQFFDPAK